MPVANSTGLAVADRPAWWEVPAWQQVLCFRKISPVAKPRRKR